MNLYDLNKGIECGQLTELWRKSSAKQETAAGYLCATLSVRTTLT